MYVCVILIEMVRSFTITADRTWNLAAMTVALIFVSCGEHRFVLWMTKSNQTGTVWSGAQNLPRRSLLSKYHTVSRYTHKRVLHWHPQATCSLPFSRNPQPTAVCADRLLQRNSAKIENKKKKMGFAFRTEHRISSLNSECSINFCERILLRNASISYQNK